MDPRACIAAVLLAAAALASCATTPANTGHHTVTGEVAPPLRQIEIYHDPEPAPLMIPHKPIAVTQQDWTGLRDR